MSWNKTAVTRLGAITNMCAVCGLRSMVYGLLSAAYGLWSVVYGLWPLVGGCVRVRASASAQVCECACYLRRAGGNGGASKS